MSQGARSEVGVSLDGEENNGIFRPGRSQRETLLMVLQLAAQYET